MGDSYKNTGRKRSTDDQDESDGKKMKNRAAATKSRQKKKYETETLKKKNEELVRTNQELTSKKQELEKKLKQCIEEITKHKSYGCSLPRAVTDIIQSAELSNEDFLPVGIQSCGTSGSFGSNSFFRETEDHQMLPDNQLTIKGLFSGNEFPADSTGQTRRRNPSSRSPSRSPPAPAVAIQSQPSTSKSGGDKRQGVLNWKPLHQQMFGEEESPHPSPVQTVPNIDLHIYTPNAYQKYDGFPDISDAVQSAQNDQGICENDYVKHSSEDYSLPGLFTTSQDKSALLSTGFAPTVSAPTLSSEQNIASIKFCDSLKSTASNSVTVSMNHTAELLSQAMTNFEACEISEDLKKQIVSVATSQNSEEANARVQNPQGLMQNVHFGNEVVYTNEIQEYSFPNPVQPQIVESNNSSSITYESLLELAKNHDQNITLQIQGKDYEVDYETLKSFISRLRQDQDSAGGQASNVETFSNDNIANFMTSQHQESGSTVFFDALLDPIQQAVNPGLDQGVMFTPQNHASKSQQATVASVQYDQLPTTVQSMIRQECPDSTDYSENVKDLPSLSLTEDDTNIFEKKRRTT